MTDYHEQIRQRMGVVQEQPDEVLRIARKLERAGMENLKTSDHTPMTPASISYEVPATAFSDLEPASTGSAMVFEEGGGFGQFIIRLPRTPAIEYGQIPLTDDLEAAIESQTSLPRPWLLRVSARDGRLDPHVKTWTDMERGPSVLHGSLTDPYIRYHPSPEVTEPEEHLTPAEAADVIIETVDAFYGVVDVPHFNEVVKR